MPWGEWVEILLLPTVVSLPRPSTRRLPPTLEASFGSTANLRDPGGERKPNALFTGGVCKLEELSRGA